jgi:hypothetical protein
MLAGDSELLFVLTVAGKKVPARVAHSMFQEVSSTSHASQYVTCYQ